jgi:hypothetical protein
MEVIGKLTYVEVQKYSRIGYLRQHVHLARLQFVCIVESCSAVPRLRPTPSQAFDNAQSLDRWAPIAFRPMTLEATE